MDIVLNLSTETAPVKVNTIHKPSIKVAKGRHPARKISKSGSSNEFAFEFGGGGQKVKAIVARRRPVAKVVPVAKANESTNVHKLTPSNSLAFGKKSSISSVAKVVPVAKANKSSNVHQLTPSNSIAFRKKSLNSSPVTPGQSKSLELEAKPRKDTENKQPPVSDLMLNIVYPTDISEVLEERKQKLTRAERLSQKRYQRRGPASRVSNEKVLTQKEINEGIRRFSENPNRKSQQVNNDEEVKIDTKARKTNAFRVKRPEDSTVKKINLFKNNPETKVLGQKLVKPITEKVFAGAAISSLDLHPHCVKNLADILSITELTTVQQKTIPHALQGKDILVRSQTGSGKTLAYALPVVQKLQEIRPKLNRECGIYAVVVVPTRELAIQTYELFIKLLKPFTWLVTGIFTGGERRKAEKARLRKGINILVGTPGRLVDHLLHTESFKLSKAKFLVLDEADRLLEMGYERDVKQIVEAIGEQRKKEAEEATEPLDDLQTLLLSATLTSAVQKLAGLALREPMFIDNSDEDPSAAVKSPNGYDKTTIELAAIDTPGEDSTGILVIPENLQLSYVIVPPKLRLVTLSGLLAKEFLKKKLKAMVFMSTMEMVNFHHDLLNEQLTQRVLDEDDEEADADKSDDDADEPLLKGLRFFKLHGSMTQTERQGVFKGFRDCKSGVLLATDVVGRGIDVPEVDLVVQYSPPQKTADFVHRVGRTARAGRSGRAVLFLTPSESNFVRNLEDKRIRISQIDMDVYLRTLQEADDEANNIQEAASNLQHKFQELITDDKEMHDKACKAFVSWMKFYSTFPKELKPIFNIKAAHMGHFAKSFGLKDQPTSFTKKHSVPKLPPPTNRLTYTERDPEKIKLERKTKQRLYATTVSGAGAKSSAAGNRLHKLLPTSRTLTTSEFDSGLPALKKRKV